MGDHNFKVILRFLQRDFCLESAEEDFFNLLLFLHLVSLFNGGSLAFGLHFSFYYFLGSDTMSTAGEPMAETPDLPTARRRHPPRGDGPPRPKYPSDDIDYKKRRRPDAKPRIQVPLERWDE